MPAYLYNHQLKQLPLLLANINDFVLNPRVIRGFKFRLLTCGLLGSCLLSGLAQNALAQENLQTTSTLEPVVVQRTRTDLLGIANSSSEGEAGAKQLLTRPVLRPGEVLELVPGLIATQHSGDGKANQYFLRGFNLDHGTDFATFVDGVPVNLRTHGHGQGYTDLNFLIPELVERVSYRKGTYAPQDGDFSSAGSARIQTLSKLAKPFFQTEVGQYQFLRFVGAHSVATPYGDALIALETQGSNGIWEVPQNYRKVNALLKLKNKTENGDWSFSAMSYRAKWTATDQVPVRAIEQGLLTRYGSLDPSTGGISSRDSLSVSWMHRGTNDQLQLNAYVVRSSLNLFSNFTYFTRGCSAQSEADSLPIDCNSLTTPRDQFEQADRRTLLGTDLSYKVEHTLLGSESSSTVGLQLRSDRIGAVGLYETRARLRDAVIREDAVRENSVGIYLQNNSRWSSWLRSELGLRFDQFNFLVQPTGTVEAQRKTASIVSPKASLTFGPWNKTELYFNWGQGFHSNDARGVTSADNPATALVKTRGSEFGIRSSAIRGLESTFTLWQLALGSELVFVGDAGTTEAGRPSRRKGVEWTNTWRPALGWFAKDAVSIDADFSISKSRFNDVDVVGNKIPGSPQRVASLGFSADAKGAWYSGFRVRYFGKRPLVEDGSVNSASNFMGNFKLGYRFNKNLQAELDVFNVFNKQVNDIEYLYASRLRGEPIFSEATAKPDLHIHPSEPRNFRLMLKLSF
jgi:outer membrane receptor protein involved in Fe transport